MRKRKNSSSEEEEGSDMEVEGEAKMGDQEEGLHEDSSDDDGGDDDELVAVEGSEMEVPEDDDAVKYQSSMPAPVDNPFMDSFYSLSSSNPLERAQAAQTMLLHCLLGSSANSKDAAYALRRLLNGLCSGRAAARQGYASALASFLKIAYQLKRMDEIRNEVKSRDDSEEESSSDLMYIRERLLSATDPSQIMGRKKGSEERDYQFGRLFGILAVVRSRILVPGSPSNSEEVKEMTTVMLSDLVDLFWQKKWMREPAAHGIATMLNLFFDGDDDCLLIAHDLVHNVIIPNLLLFTQEREEEYVSDRQKLLEGYCAEQIGIAAYIQSNCARVNKPLAFPLDEAVVTTATIPSIALALSETSSVVHPRMHFVWDALWCFLTKEEGNPKKDSRDISTRTLVDKTPLSRESARQVVEGIIRVVLKEKLLRMEEESLNKKITHERRSLALCIVKHLSGVPFLSSLDGQTQILLDGDCIESFLLTPEIIQALFVNVITGGRQRQNASLLKPMALDILGAMTASAAKVGGSRRLSYVKAFLSCDARFDSHTKTSTLADTLGFSSERVPSEEDLSRWDVYLDHLEAKFLSFCKSVGDTDATSQAISCAEMLYNAAKSILRAGNDSEDTVDSKVTDYKERSASRILAFFMATAFFDCSGLAQPSTGKKKKGKKISTSPAVSIALNVKERLGDGNSIPHAVRSIVAARFFSLTSEFAMVVARESNDEGDTRGEKDTNTLRVLEGLCDDWRDLESTGAKRYEIPGRDTNEDDDEPFDPEEAVTALRKCVRENEKSRDVDADDSLNQSRKRCCTGIAVLALTLYLHRLHCGINDSMNEDPDADEEDDEDEICNALEGLKSIADDFFGDEEPDSNPLLGLAELCANILSSPIGSGSIGRGSSPKLVREAVRYAWLGGLRLASSKSTEEKTLLDSSVIDVLMEAIGADLSVENDGNDASEESDDQSASGNNGDDDDESGNDGIFTKASKIVDDVENMEMDEEGASSAEDDDSEVEIDPSKLQTMLEEDSDADVDEKELEHHEGADSALAKLIKLKQDARKAGQQAREKIEISNQLRCTTLLETLLGRPDSWNRLFRSNLLEMVMPLLLHRQRVAIMVQKAVDGGSKTGAGEKKALLERLSSIIKQKLFKLRLSSMPLANAVNPKSGEELVKSVIKEAKRAKDKEQVGCCSSCLIFVLRAMPSSSQTVSIVSTEYGQVVHEWSTKRSSGASLLEDLINHMPSMAQATLIPHLNRAALESRSSFLRLEAFRLLSLLCAIKVNRGDSEIQKLARSSIENSQHDVLGAILAGLEDEEMSKPKRARVMFRTVEKLLPCVSAPASSEVTNSLKRLKAKIEELGQPETGGRSDSRLAASTKLVRLIDQTLTELDTAGEAQQPTEHEAEKAPQAESKTKKSKKKKKKKR